MDILKNTLRYNRNHISDSIEMSEKAIAKFIKISDIAAREDKLQHVVMMLSNDGQILVSGSSNFTEALKATESFTDIKNILLDNKQTEGDIVASQLIEYPLLPCPPNSAGWKNSSMIRGVLTKMLGRVGYGDSGRKKKLGVGNPPLGWPDNVSWPNFRGATRSGLSVHQVTDIIISMLQAAQVDPFTYVKASEILPPIEQEDVMENDELNALEEENQNDEVGGAPEFEKEYQISVMNTENSLDAEFELTSVSKEQVELEEDGAIRGFATKDYVQDSPISANKLVHVSGWDLGVERIGTDELVWIQGRSEDQVTIEPREIDIVTQDRLDLDTEITADYVEGEQTLVTDGRMLAAENTIVGVVRKVHMVERNEVDDFDTQSVVTKYVGDGDHDAKHVDCVAEVYEGKIGADHTYFKKLKFGN